jgi:hypothetical protein
MGMFDNAKVLKTKKPSKATPKTAEIVTKGLEGVAALDAVIKSLTALKGSLTDEIKNGPMRSHFLNTGLASGVRPENYRGVEGDASASCEMRIRSSASALTEDEISLLARHKIPTEVIVDTVETFVINPEYLSDTKIMSQIEAALKKVKGLPDDLIMKQEGKDKTVVGETALDVLFQKDVSISEKMREVMVEDLFPVLTVLAIKPKMDTDDLAAAFSKVQKLILPAKKDEKAKATA